MSHRRLPQEVVSLIHHVELNQSGWWKKAVCQIAKGLLWRSKSPLSHQDLQVAFRAEIGYAIGADQLEQQIKLLISAGEVTPLPDGRLKIAEAVKEKLTAEIEGANAQQEECKRLFMEDIRALCPGLDPAETWDSFSAELGKVISTYGANAFHIIIDGKLEKEVDWLERYIETKPDHKAGLNVAIRNVFDPERTACKSQILRLMSANFFAEASQLNQATLEALESKRKGGTVRVLLDTNFIFSLLNLHDNPANDSAASLLDLGQRGKGAIEIKFYVLPGTLVEARSTLEHQLERIKNIRITKSMFGAVRSYPFSGIASKYFESSAKAPGLTPEAFLNPYIESLPEILKRKGVLTLEEQSDGWSQRQSVIDDVLAEEAHEAKLPDHKRKGYKSLMHDVILWHVAKSRRAKNLTSPLDVDFWGVTADWRLIAFDQRKRTSEEPLPVVLYPTNLIQLLQFWIPRDSLLEASLIDSFRLPLFFTRFDVQDEAATLNVLRVISRYENIDDLPEETVSALLANQALKDKLMAVDKGNEEELELIREYLLVDVKEGRKRLEDAESALRELTDKARRKEEEAANFGAKLETTVAEKLGLLGDLQRVAEEAEEASRRLEEERDRADSLQKAVEDFRVRSIRNRNIATYSALLAVVLALSTIATWLAVERFDFVVAILGKVAFCAATFSMAFVVLHFFVEVFLGNKVFEGLAPFRGAKWIRRWLWIVVGVFLIGGTGNTLLGNKLQKNLDALEAAAAEAERGP